MRNMQTNNYRQRIYTSYGKDFQDESDEFDFEASLRWGKTRRYHLRGWLPESKTARIVDLACGGGKLLHFFSEQGYQRVEGVDISPDQVELSRQITPNVTPGNVIEFLEANTGQFDLITGFDIVEHFYKDEVLRFLDAAHAALKPGGRMILQTPNAGVPWGVQTLYGDFTHETGFNSNALERLLRVTGFSNNAVRECDPPPYGLSLFSSIRFMLWQVIRLQMMARNLIETGSTGGRVFTRVFLVTGIKVP
jgi:2-polyprenyl-3-methyl-5-hydroxy-6-metoxy-1,4-benzoquinol methylase